jgi:hypothetical protein
VCLLPGWQDWIPALRLLLLLLLWPVLLPA